MTIPDKLCRLNYPIETELQKKFWSSRHKCNIMKSIIAFSLSAEDANNNLRRRGYTYQWRKKAIISFAKYINTPSMVGVPFNELSTPYWECMKNGVIPETHWVANFTGKSGQALSTKRKFILSSDDYFEFNTRFNDSDMDRDFTLVSTDVDDINIEVHKGVITPSKVNVLLDNKLLNGKIIPEHLRNKKVRVRMTLSEPNKREDVNLFFGGCLDGHIDSVSSYIDTIRYFSLDNIDDSVFWYATLSNSKPTYSYMSPLDIEVRDRLDFTNIVGWKPFESPEKALKLWDDVDLWDDNRNWIEYLEYLDSNM